MKDETLQVFMLEEDSDDRYLTEDILTTLELDLALRFFSDSKSMLQALERQQGRAVVHVDYNLTTESGVQVLQQIKANAKLKHLPVVILSESVLPRYVQECYASGASTVVKKPDTMVGTKKTIETF